MARYHNNINYIIINKKVPGPCNMHSADLIREMIYIFRGGDGRDYLNDLHSLNTETSQWKLVVSEGD